MRGVSLGGWVFLFIFLIFFMDFLVGFVFLAAGMDLLSGWCVSMDFSMFLLRVYTS